MISAIVGYHSHPEILCMSVHPIRLLGDPILRARCETIAKPRSSAARIVIDDLRETLRERQRLHGWGRGLAGPQIGAPVRIVYIEVDKPWVLINPEIVDIGTEDFDVWDDCFSIPDLLVRVSRAYHIRVRHQDLKGTWQTTDLEGPMAELVQHEIDHLDGVLIVDRPQGIDPFCFRSEWEKHHARGGRYGAPEPRSANYATPLAGLL